MGLLDKIGDKVKKFGDDLLATDAGQFASDVLGIVGIDIDGEEEVARRKNPALPNRQDVVMQVLNQQLETLTRRKGALGGISPMQGPTPEQSLTASESLFGV